MEAAAWYDERRIGLGREFLEAIDEGLAFVGSWPRSGKRIPDVPHDLPFRRTPVRRFPYHIVYVETPRGIRIIAFAHDRRSPAYWYSRIKQS
jgi:toxin ParE1/3/4